MTAAIVTAELQAHTLQHIQKMANTKYALVPGGGGGCPCLLVVPTVTKVKNAKTPPLGGGMYYVTR